MLYIKFFENTWLFDNITLKKWEVLFDEWDTDNNLYIIKKWSLSIEKYLTNDKIKTKQLATLKKEDFLWEWSLKHIIPKQVKVSAIENTQLIKIDAKKWLAEFIEKFPKQWLNLLTHIITVSNKRLLDSNFLLTTSYEISKSISEIETFDNKSIIKLLDKFNKIIKTEYILFVERNPVMKNFVSVKYDTRNSWKMQNNLVNLWDNKLDIKDLKLDWIELQKHNYIQELKNWNEILWYLIFWEKDKGFSTTEIKVINSISILIAWVVKQKENLEDEKNKISMKWEE